MSIPDSSPTTSYSDPIYDRLDIIARAVRRRWWLYLLVLIAIILAAVMLRSYVTNRPHEASAAAFNRALDAPDETERLSRLKTLAQDQGSDPYYRARAWIELTQVRLEKEDANGAKEAAIQAVSQAKATGDSELLSAARLSQAAAEFQLADYNDALADYTSISQGTARYPELILEATLGAARTQMKQGKPNDAIATLEPLLTRSDTGAERLLEMARVMYWDLKRQQSQPGSTPTPAPTTSSSPSKNAATVPPTSSSAPSGGPATVPVIPPTGTTTKPGSP